MCLTYKLEITVGCTHRVQPHEYRDYCQEYINVFLHNAIARIVII